MLGDWATDDRWNDWQLAIANDGVFPSLYARDAFDYVDPVTRRHNPSEDFAEVLLAYWSVKGTPLETEMRELMPARFAILDNLSLEASLRDLFA
jgi:hypothetical protein